MSHFQTRVKNFFAIRENFFSRRPFGRGRLVGANGFMRLFDPTVKHFSAKNFVDLLHADCLFNQHTGKTQKNVCIFFQATYCPPKKSRYRQCRNGALAMHPPAFPAPPIQRHKTAGGASLAATSSSHRWRRTPNEGIPRPSPSSCDERTSRSSVSGCPASAIKKAGKGLPFPACHD